MEKKILHIYTLTEDKKTLRYATAAARPINPTVPLWKNKECMVKGFTIRNLDQTYRKKIWYQTDQVFIITERDDNFAYRHFIKVRKEKADELFHRALAQERILDELYESMKNEIISEE